MTPTQFDGQTNVIAEHQPEYGNLPAHFDRHTGVVTCCWKASWRERLQVLLTGRVWHQVLTFGQPLQPQKIEASKPELT